MGLDVGGCGFVFGRLWGLWVEAGAGFFNSGMGKLILGCGRLSVRLWVVCSMGCTVQLVNATILNMSTIMTVLLLVLAPLDLDLDLGFGVVWRGVWPAC
jgi:hypothetical protein